MQVKLKDGNIVTPLDYGDLKGEYYRLRDFCQKNPGKVLRVTNNLIAEFFVPVSMVLLDYDSVKILNNFY